ncbi:ATP-binding protein [Geofilum sp. OHC36d9]|uniref:ATP-binding protein n=1 Tax=Geofilum sp. OHC36d9 TaxID=3458413 RepID=UPI004033C7DB
MAIKQALTEIFEAVGAPLFLFNRELEAVYLNKMAVDIFEVNSIDNICLECVGSDCLNVQTIDDLIQNNLLSNNQAICIRSKGLKKTITGNLSYLKKEELVLITLVNYLGLKNETPKAAEYIPPQMLPAIFSQIIDNSQTEFFMINDKGVILMANEIARKATGITLDKNTPVYLSHFNPSANEEWWNKQKTSTDSEARHIFETRHYQQNGTLYPVVVNMFKLAETQAPVYAYYCTNITDRYDIEETLLKESKINQNLAEISAELAKKQKLNYIQLLVRQYALEITNSSFAFIIYHDPDKRELKVSIYNDTNKNFDEEVRVIEKHISELYTGGENIDTHHDFIINSKSKFKIGDTTIDQLLPFKNMVMTGVFSNEQYMGLLLVAGRSTQYTETDAEHLNSLSNLFAVAINRAKANNQLSESLAQLELAMNVANMTLIDAAVNQNRLIINQSWCKILGIATIHGSEHITLTRLLRRIHPDDFQKLITQINEHRNSNSASFKINMRLRIKNNSYKWIMTTGSITALSEDGSINRIMGVAVDITEQINLNNEIIQSREEAVEANKAKSAFLARISHEFRTPLNAIIGFTDVLIGNAEAGMQMDYLKSIKKSGVNLLNLINDILDFSKLEANKMTLYLKPTDIVTIGIETSNLFIHALQAKDIKFKQEIEKSIPRSLLLDELHIRQVITNLLSNAVKFTDRGQITFSITHQPSKDETTTLIIRVTDTGIGIAEASKKKVFEDFSQQDNQDNRRYGGTGLGLGIVKRLVELMNGSIDLESKSGEGSTFTITLPDIQLAPYDPNSLDESPEIKTETHETKQSNTNPVNPQCCRDIMEALSPEWDTFKTRPSFKKVDGITHKIKEVNKKYQNAVIEEILRKMEHSVDSFDVETLATAINELDNYIKQPQRN